MPKHHDSRGGKKGIFDIGVGVLSFGAVASAIAGTHKILETAVQLRHLWDVAEDNMVFVRIIDRVQLDLLEVERLMEVAEVKEALRRTPAKVEWIAETISSVREALEKTAKYTKRVRKDSDRGRWVGLRNRIWFRAEEFEKLELHSIELARCHSGLLAVLGLLSEFELGTREKHQGIYEKAGGNDDWGSRYQSIGYGQTIRDERREVNYQVPRDDFAEEGDIVYTKDGDGPGYNAEVVADRYDVQQLQDRHSERSHWVTRDDEGYASEETRYGGGEHITEVEVDRYVDRDDGKRVEARYVEKRGDDRHSHHDRRHDQQYIDVKRRAEVRRHGETVEVDGYEERDDGRHVEAHYVERRDDGRHSHHDHQRHGHSDDRYIDMHRRAEVRRRHHDHDEGHRERVSSTDESHIYRANVW